MFLPQTLRQKKVSLFTITDMILIRTVSETEAQNGYLNRTVDTLIRFTTMLHTPSTLQRWRQHLRYIYIYRSSSLAFIGVSALWWRGSQLATMNDDVPETKWRTRNRVASHFIGERSQPLALTLASARVKTKTKTKQKGQGEESRFGPSELSNHLKNKGYIALNLIP